MSSMGCDYSFGGHDLSETEVEINRVEGNNYDIVTYKHGMSCTFCGVTLEGDGESYNVRENVKGHFTDVDERDGQSPSRWGT